MRWLVLCVVLLLANRGLGQELTEHPDLVLKPFEPNKITVYGLKIGDDVARVPEDRIDIKHETYVDLRGGWRLGVEDGKIASLGFTRDAKEAWRKIGVRSEDDIEFVFGKADRMRDGTGSTGSRSYVYLKRKLVVVVFDGPASLTIRL